MLKLKEIEELIITYLQKNLPDINIAWSKNFNNLPPEPYFVQIEHSVEHDEFLIWLIKYSSNITENEIQNIRRMYNLICDFEHIDKLGGSIPQKAEVYFKCEDDVDYRVLDSHVVQCPIIVKLKKENKNEKK